MCVCVFGFNVAFNNFSVISRRCLVATGSSMLIFVVLPHWNIMSQTLDMIPHPVTISWHWVDQSKLYPGSLSAKRGAASTIFLRIWYVAGRDRTRDLPFPGADTLPTELSGPVLNKARDVSVWSFLSVHICAASWQNQQNDCAPSKDSDQPGQMPRLSWVFSERTCILLGFVMRRLISCANSTGFCETA